VEAEVQEASLLAAGGFVGEKSSTRFVIELAAMAATFVSTMKVLVESPAPLTPPEIERVDQSAAAGSALKSAVYPAGPTKAAWVLAIKVRAAKHIGKTSERIKQVCAVVLPLWLMPSSSPKSRGKSMKIPVTFKIASAYA
jgi:hypothetical protein